jgi:ELWxxDGT repeat protein
MALARLGVNAMRTPLPRAAVVLLFAVGTLAAAVRPTPPAHATTVARVGWGRATRFGDLGFFVACGEPHGCELWRTDGTPEGTRLLKDIQPGPQGSAPYALTRANDRLFFVATDAAHGCELWQTNGTEAGTVVHDLAPGPASSCPYRLTPAGRHVYFTATDPAVPDREAGQELWRTDGVARVHSRLRDLLGPAGRLADMAAFGDRVVVQAFLEPLGTPYPIRQGLFVSDATPEGTALLKSPGHDQIGAYTHAEMGGVFYFYGEDEAHGRELWRTDGTPAGTTIVRDLVGGPDSTDLRRLTALGPRLLFEAFIPATGSEPWVTDGTAAGTLMLGDIQPGAGSSMHRPPYGTFFTKADGGLAGSVVFSAEVADKRQELWRTDGTAAATRRIGLGHGQTSATSILELTPVGAHVYFVADDDVHGRELWRTDGTAGGTALVRDIAPGPTSSHPFDFGADERTLAFVASDGTTRALWQAEGITLTRLADNAPEWPLPLPRGVVYVGTDEKGVPRVWVTGRGRRPVAVSPTVVPPEHARN